MNDRLMPFLENELVNTFQLMLCWQRIACCDCRVGAKGKTSGGILTQTETR